MRKFLFLLTLLHLTYVSSFAQESDTIIRIKKESKAWKGLLFDFGFNHYTRNNNSALPELNVWRSKGVNLYHFWGIPIGRSFAIAPGLGLGLENYSFRNEDIRLRAPDDSLIIFTENIPGFVSKKSKLAVNYIDIPLEFRFQTGRYKERAFRFAIGGKVGFMYGAHTKFKYVSDNRKQTTKEKLHDDFGLEGIRYGLTARIGFSNINFFGYYSLSDLFIENKGPQTKPFMIGITIINPFDLKDLPSSPKKIKKHYSPQQANGPVEAKL